MKPFFAIFALGVIVHVNGAIFEFDLGPGGMNGGNVRPTPFLTTATGGELSAQPGISYDDSTHQLFLNFGWGTDQGYTDLVGNFNGAAIDGPANQSSTASELYNLSPLINTTSISGHDGGVFGRVLQLMPSPNATPYTIPQQESQLLAGNWYINIRSALGITGEIRGQLVPVPEPQTYGLTVAAGLLSFALYRRYKRSTRTAQ